MKREKRLTKKERKALSGRTTAHAHHEHHIHCVACGRHIEPSEFEGAQLAKMVRCQHGSTFATCVECEDRTIALLAEHDRTGQPVKFAAAWH